MAVGRELFVSAKTIINSCPCALLELFATAIAWVGLLLTKKLLKGILITLGVVRLIKHGFIPLKTIILKLLKQGRDGVLNDTRCIKVINTNKP